MGCGWISSDLLSVEGQGEKGRHELLSLWVVSVDSALSAVFGFGEQARVPRNDSTDISDKSSGVCR